MLINYAWSLWIEAKTIIVPTDIAQSFEIWEISVGTSILFVFVLMYLSITKGYYERHRTN